MRDGGWGMGDGLADVPLRPMLSLPAILLIAESLFPGESPQSMLMTARTRPIGGSPW
jgi:hypothetical protein